MFVWTRKEVNKKVFIFQIDVLILPQTKKIYQCTTDKHQERHQEIAEGSCAHTSGLKPPSSVVSGGTVAQLVIEDDSQTSELESTGCQEAPSPVVVCSEEDPLDSVPVSSTPVRRRRKSALR